MPLGAARFGLGGGLVDLGKLELLQTQTISSATANFTSLDVSTYNVHLFTMSDLVVTTQSEFGLRVSDDGVVLMKLLIIILVTREDLQVAVLLKEKVHHKEALDLVEMLQQLLILYLMDIFICTMQGTMESIHFLQATTLLHREQLMDLNLEVVYMQLQVQ